MSAYRIQDCGLALWTAAPAIVALVVILITSLPLGIKRTWLGHAFTPFLTLPEAEVLLGMAPTEEQLHDAAISNPKHSPSTIALAVLATSQLVIWTAFAVIAVLHESSTIWPATALAAVWAYAAGRLALSPRPTAQMPLFWIFLAHLCGSIVRLGAPLYVHYSDPLDVPLPQHRDLLASTYLAPALIVRRFVHANRQIQGVTLTPEDYASLWQWINFSWVYPIFAKMSPTITTKAVFLKFISLKQSTLFKQLWHAHSHDMLIHFALVALSLVLQYTQPVFLNKILATINGDSSDAARSLAVVYALLMFGASLLKAESDLQHLWISRRVAGQIRCELMTAIYEKALKRQDLSGAVKETNKKEGEEPGGEDENSNGADIGKIVNLMSNDVERLSHASLTAFIFLGAPVEIVIAFLLLYRLLGWSAFAGFATFIVVLPINQYLTKRGVKISEKRMAATDTRMSSVNELVTEAKFIKFFAWEGKWIDRVLAARSRELSWVVKGRINNVLFGLVWSLVPNFVSTIAFVVYIYTGNSLTVPTAFTAIALFQMLQYPLNIIPRFVSLFLQWGVSVRRVQGFLEEGEIPDFVSSLKARPHASRDAVLGIEQATFVHAARTAKRKEEKTTSEPWFWSLWLRKATQVDATISEEPSSEQQFELRDINVTFPTGKLTLVTGPTASGKSSLLRALLGEMVMISTAGKVLVPKDTHTQTPWLQHATIKDNIIYGSPLDEERYTAVIEACALEPDLKILQDGDSTEIGARGVSLSGGQKARVALARAVYQRTKIVLLDDPLSAVDSHTARRLLDKLFRGPLLADRTVVLVTHHVGLMLPAASHVLRMHDGRVDAFGSVSELRAQKTNAVATGEKNDKKVKQLVEDEARAEGMVKWRIHDTYLKAAGYITWAVVVLLLMASQGVYIGLIQPAYATQSARSISNSPLPTAQHPFADFSVLSVASPASLRATFQWPNADEHPLYYVGVYGAIAIGGAVVGLILQIVEYLGAYRASKILFKRLLIAVVRAPFRWFDTTPTGRILNRFSKDVDVIDNSLSGSLLTVLNEFSTLIAGVAVIAYILPAFLIPAAVVVFIYYRLAVAYLNASRLLRRMEANSRSPVFESFSELLTGIVTVRAFSSEHRFLDRFYKLTDSMNRSYWAFWMLSRYLMFRFDVIGAFTVLATTLIGLFSMGPSGDFAGWAGITITTSINMCLGVYWIARFYAELELDLNSVERVAEYLDIVQEPPAVVESNRPPAYWPSSTSGPATPLLQVQDLTIKYAPDLPAVLHEISFSLHAKERVGLLGRTGSGKSTVAMSLLRFVDPAGGKILVDGIDISTIGLQDLRSNVTFIPQDASLFSGTVRDNLDPFNDYTDEQCAEVLARVQLVSNPASALKSSIGPSATSSRAATPNDERLSVSTLTHVGEERKSMTLTTQVSAGGANFSHGQRQLVSLARALLRRSNIIIMDEATSSIDFETDAKIQATIREEFKNSLLLTVAHRLKTIADYDRLIVLDKGRIAEFDTPAQLILKKGGIFRDMALKSGIFSELESIARGKANGPAAAL
ncbi:P-loop containing nucleoside triphosphate hydrolase protein [Auriculariales sp. MPI-PUGE-AT-0066]|nr:P-loop containing nucleoside triphosphate hydrolase protein [Auriculariales sp. MPI-PUGE-AT-0066]